MKLYRDQTIESTCIVNVVSYFLMCCQFLPTHHSPKKRCMWIRCTLSIAVNKVEHVCCISVLRNHM